MNPPAQACASCQRGPTGIAGHDELYSETMGASEMHFTCRTCRRSWARSHAEGSFAWRAIDRPAGSDVPGKPGTTPP